MRSFDERRQEIFLRSEKRIANRKKRTKLLFACIPLVICIAVSSVVLLQPTIHDDTKGNDGMNISEDVARILPEKSQILRDNGYEVNENYKLDQNAYSENAIIQSWNSLKEYEKDFYDIGHEKLYAEYLVIKGKKIDSAHYHKDCGYYQSPEYKSSKIKTRDIRSFVLTEIEITEVINQVILDGRSNYVRGDRLVLFNQCEQKISIRPDNSGWDYSCIETRPVPDDEAIFYIYLHKEPIKLGSDHFGYDIIDDVFAISIFASKVDPDHVYSHIQQEMIDKYSLKNK
ncbi:MAG: hypothetical protein IJF54_05500 [Clostridia bacterium]|nr:hypothetical protein [Clostridia bacterium]